MMSASSPTLDSSFATQDERNGVQVNHVVIVVDGDVLVAIVVVAVGGGGGGGSGGGGGAGDFSDFALTLPSRSCVKSKLITNKLEFKGQLF